MKTGRFPFLVIAFFLIWVGGLASCRSKKVDHFNLLVITLDTTRADGIGVYGNPDASTPNIDRLAKNGIMFENCYTAVPLTLPSHCTLFTGRYPMAHQVRNNGTYFLPEAETTLAEILKKNSFRTFACIASFTLLAKFGLGQGFEAYDETFRQKQAILNFNDEIPAEEITRKFTAWLEMNHGSKFFTWLHFFDAHSPYELHPELDSAFTRSERLKYEGEIAYVDLHIGKILRSLQAKGILRQTIIVIVGDHGEGFGEHKEFGHGIFCYEESLKVPLILYNPVLFARSRKIDSRINLADILPTLLHYLEVPCPENVQGRSFHGLIAGKKEKRQRDVYFESRFGLEANNWAPITGMIVDDHKYISLIEPELYDLGQDAAERVNLFKRENILARKLDGHLRRCIVEFSANGETGRRALSADDIASLKTLGYVTPASARAREMVDPKKGLDLYMQVEFLKEKARAGSFPEAQAGLDQVMARNPGVQLPNFFELEFMIKKNTGRMTEALAVLQKAVSAFPDNESFKIILATELVSCNEHDRAQALCREILKKDPRFAAALILLGDISRKRNNRPEAVEYYKQALKIEPQNTRVQDILSELSSPSSGRTDELPAAAGSAPDATEAKRRESLEKTAVALIGENRLDQAREILENILRLEPDNVDALVNIGTVAYRSGEFALALQHYQKAVRLNPRHAMAFSNMGIAYFGLFQKENDRSLLPLALQHFNTAIQLDAGLAEAYNGRGAVYLVMNENSKAVLDFQKVIRMKPGDVDAHFNIAYALVDAGRKNEAMDVLIRFKKSFYRKLNPKDQHELDSLIAAIGS